METTEFYDISFDAVEENCDQAWHSLLHNLSNSDLENLEKVFKNKLNEDGSEIGLTKNEFLEAISNSYEGPQYSLQATLLFEEINQPTVTWNDFLDFHIQNMYNLPRNRLQLHVGAIEQVAHGKNESVAKIVLIETEQYFCYAIILKHGRVGLYDGNLNFLTCYHAVMTREDLTRPEDERRRRNRWVTDALFCPDTLMFIITNTARSIMIYEASGLNHVPYWLILSTPNILECLDYKPYEKVGGSSYYSSSILYAGDCYGQVLTFTFHQPKTSLLRRKRNDNITLFYWTDFLKEKDHVTVKTYSKVHKDSVKNIKYYTDLKLLVTCSKDPNNSVILKQIDTKGSEKTVYKVTRGVSCFALSVKNRVLITGSDNGIIRIWNIFISKPVAIFSEYDSEVADIQIIESKDLFLSCSTNAVLKLWDLKDHTCLQTLKLKFPSFRVEGKLIEWGINCIFPGPRRKQPEESSCDENKRTCFGINDISEMVPEFTMSTKRDPPNIWNCSCILVTCCNSIAKLRTSFDDASLELSFSNPILPPPPLQNSVLIPNTWRLQNDTLGHKDLNKMGEFNIEKQLRELSFILDKDILEESGARSDINYKIAILESKKEKMRSKVALGSPYLALDLHDISEVQLSPDLKLHNQKKAEKYRSKIESMLRNAAHKDAVFSSPEPSSSRSRSSKSSVVDLPF